MQAAIIALAFHLAFGMSRRSPPTERAFWSGVRQQALLSKLDGGKGVFFVDSFASADPMGVNDSTLAVQAAVDAAFAHTGQSTFEGNMDLMGGTVHLGGGEYLISNPITVKNAANLRFCCGSLRTATDFPSDAHMITVSGGEDVSFDHLMLDCDHAEGALQFANNVRVHLFQIYAMHFRGIAIHVTGGHEVHVSHCFIGQYRWSEQVQVEAVTGTAIQIDGQDHWISDSIIFSSLYGIVLNGGASIVTNTHIYDMGDAAGPSAARKMEAAVYVKGQNVRLVGDYFDYNPVVLVDPVSIHVTQCFFLGGVGVEIRSSGSQAFVSGLQVTNNQFVCSGSKDAAPWEAIRINESAGAFMAINETIVVDNSFPTATYGASKGQAVTRRETVVRRSLRQTTGTIWSFDLCDELAFPRLGVEHVTHEVQLHNGGFVQSALRDVEGCVVKVELSESVDATVYITAVQGLGNSVKQVVALELV